MTLPRVKRLERRDWSRFEAMLDKENVAWARISTHRYGSSDRTGYRSDSTDDTIEVALKSTKMVKGARRIPLKITKAVRLNKAEEKVGLYASWALVSREKDAEGEWTEHEDRDGDTMSDEVLLKAFMDTFGAPVPLYKDHNSKDRDVRGMVMFAPMTVDIQKGLGFDGELSGLIALMKVDDESLRKEIDDGKLPDVSIEALVQVAQDA